MEGLSQKPELRLPERPILRLTARAVNRSRVPIQRRMGDTHVTSGRLMVIKAGTSFVVLDPHYYTLASNKQYTHMVMNANFKVGVTF